MKFLAILSMLAVGVLADQSSGSSDASDSSDSSSDPIAPSNTTTIRSSPTPQSMRYHRPSYMNTINYWRRRLGLRPLHFSSLLQANAQATVDANPGEMVHILFPGTWGQVLAPSDKHNFVNAFVGGWLCERPDMPGMDGICPEFPYWRYESTGHANILTSDTYNYIGCGWTEGIWGCDLSPYP